MSRFTFPVGYHDIRRTKIVNYQLNRWHSLGYSRFEDLNTAAARMRGMDDFKDEMVREGEQALAEERYVHGAFYMRGAEFFAPPHNPHNLDKLGLVLRGHSYEVIMFDGPGQGGALKHHQLYWNIMCWEFLAEYEGL